MESTESIDFSLNWKKNQEGQLYQQNYLGKAFEKAPHEREPKRKRKRSVGRGNTGPEHKDFSEKLPWDGSNMLNMRGHGRTCESTSSWGLGVGARLQWAGWLTEAVKPRKEPWGQINRGRMELLLPHLWGLWHRLSGGNFPLASRGIQHYLLILEGLGMPLAVEAKAINILLTWNKFSFILFASSAMVFKGFSWGFFVCHHLMIITSEP